MPAIGPNLADQSPRFAAPGLPAPFVYAVTPAASRQRVVNYAAKRLADMSFVTGLDPAAALRHFRPKPADAPGGLDDAAAPSASADAIAAAWSSGALAAAFDPADRRVTVRWRDGTAETTGTALAREGYGVILLGEHPAPLFDPVPLDRPRPAATDAAPAAPPGLARAAEALFAGSPGLYGALVTGPGGVVFERYGAFGGPDRATPSWSMTKAMTATQIGRLLHEGWLSGVHDPAPAPLWRDHRGIHRLITLDHLLRMRSGLAHAVFDGETGAGALGFENSFVYHDAQDAFATAQGGIVATVPGSVYRYVNSGINVLGAIIRDSIERRALPYHRTVYGLLADRIGMASYQHSADLHGNLIASGSGFATLRDYARLGLLYLQDGVWAGERLLPAGWADYALTPSHGGNPYAACFRSNADLFFPSLPRDTAWATGASDQKVIILRRHGLVVAVANETDHPMDIAALDRFCAAAIELAGAATRASAA